MSAIQSNLSDPRYGYDMDVAVTQDSINATLKLFLDKFESHEFIRCYVYEKNPETGKGQYVCKNFDEIVAEVGMNPFDIPDGSDNEFVQKLYEMKFGFAFRATMGLPTEFPLSDLPDIVELNKGNSMVTYNLVCREFQILNLANNFGDITWTNISQAQQPQPWVFTFLVDLDLRSSDSAFAYLPEDVKQAVKNLCPDSMFSVQQLYLDLNTAGLESSPRISGIDPTSETYIYLTKIFINGYFKKIQEDNQSGENPDGNFLLGYTIKPSAPGSDPSIIPTDLNFLTSPYYDQSGQETQNYPLYTLNYLVMTENHKMPVAVPFSWNWVDEDMVSSYNGVMAVRKEIFRSYLNKLLSPTLDSVCLIPSTKIECTNDPVKCFKYKLGAKEDKTSKSFTLVNDGSDKVLQFSFSKKDSDKKDFCWFNWSNIEMKYSLSSDIYFTGNIIRMVSVASMYIHLNIDAGVVEGDIVKYKVETDYELGVDSYGNLTVFMPEGSPKFTDQSEKIDPNWWAKFISLGTIDSFIDDVKGYLEVMKSFLTGHQNQILHMLTGSKAWVFPGGKTFVFKNVEFSDFQDLTANVTYAEPSLARLMNQANQETLDFEAAAAKGKLELSH